jgi:hypothetical protein
VNASMTSVPDNKLLDLMRLLMDKYEFMFNYYEETGEWLAGSDLDKAYKFYMKKKNEYIDSMVKELNEDEE